MKFYFLFILFFCLSVSVFAQESDSAAVAGIRHFQEELNTAYRNPDSTPLPPAEQTSFKGHQFYPVALDLRLKAELVKLPESKPFKMTTTTGQLRDYVRYGELHFSISGKPYKLLVYQSLDLLKKPQYQDYLFLPFTDLTNGNETYGGGRYLDLRIPETGNSLVVDFNKAYNPYCAYSNRYSCPIPPAENHLDVPVTAGVKAPETKH